MKKKENNNKTFNQIKNIYFTLDSNFDKLLKNCKTEKEKKQLKQDLVISRANYRRILNLNFNNNEPMIKSSTEKLAKLSKRIENDIKSLNITADVLNGISESVKLASTIIIVAMDLMI